MNSSCDNRLTIVGRACDLKPFETKSRWTNKLQARHIDLLECTASRNVWQFETALPPIDQLKRLSARWPRLVFLLEYEERRKRVKGLVKAKGGRLGSHRVSY